MASTPVRAATGSRRHGSSAEDPVLLSKITVPVLPGWAIPRQRIDALIAEGARGPLTLITGPPGAGKTMAITSWVGASADRGGVAWIALDEYDNRPHVFWSYVVAALRRAGITVPRAGAEAERGHAVGHEFLLRLASSLASLAQPVVLVIEDFHLLTDTDIMDGLTYVLRNAAPSLRLVISSRVQPLLPLHRYRLNGELTEIRAQDLAFSVRESSLLMEQLGIELSAQALECLTERTEGWAAGIRLAAITLDGHPDPEQFIKELGAEDSAVTGYLVDEVLNAQPASRRDFLLRTSILDRVSAGLAIELAGDEQAAGVLPALAVANAFVQPVGHGWYRYHPLFADILRLKLRRESPGQLPDLHRRAAGWYLRNGRLAEAVRHAAAAGDWQLAARMVLDALAIGQLIEPRGSRSLAEEFRHLPPDRSDTGPQLWLVAAAMDLSRGAESTRTASLEVAEGILGRLPADDQIPARLAAALIRIALGRRSGDLDAVITASARAEALLGEIPERVLGLHPAIRAQVLLARGTAELWLGDLDQAAATFGTGAAAAIAADSLHDRRECLGQLALAEVLRGRLGLAAQLAEEAVRPGESGDEEHSEPVVAAARAALAWVHLERNEFRPAHDELALADAALRIRPDKLTGATATMVAAQCRLAEGHAGASLELVSRARQGWVPPRWLERMLTILEVRACAETGNVQAAVAAARRDESQSVSGAPVALAYAWLAAGDYQAVRRALATAAAAARDKDEQLSLDEWLIDARLSYGGGDVLRGRRALGRALQLARPERVRLPFAMERAWLRPVLRRDPDLARSYRELLEPDLLTPARPVASPPASPQQPPLIVDQLSEREREVLVRLSGMLSTAEIAAEMYISVNTVKTHLKSIYRKLSADHRGEAVRRARQLKLI
ncbi:MAG: LuxR C-terminal-related transcriptional regulator [Streptosporangiaceae bacterium]